VSRTIEKPGPIQANEIQGVANETVLRKRPECKTKRAVGEQKRQYTLF